MSKTEPRLGYSILTKNVYYGRVNLEKGVWVGEKKSIPDQNFQAVVESFYEKGNIYEYENGVNKSVIVHFDKSNKEQVEDVINYLTKNFLNNIK